MDNLDGFNSASLVGPILQIAHGISQQYTDARSGHSALVYELFNESHEDRGIGERSGPLRRPCPPNCEKL